MLFHSETILNGSELVTGERIFTTFSETKIIPRREHHGKQISCLARHEALAGDLARTLVLNVKSEYFVSQEFRGLLVLTMRKRSNSSGDSYLRVVFGVLFRPI